ncbi:MAG: rhodanese-like domain-containing protein [Terriglobales bacterium]
MRMRVSVLAAALAATLLACGWAAAPARAAVPPTARRITAAALAARIRKGERPLIFQVGFEELYAAAHIPGARYAGPAAQPQGMARLRAALAKLPRSRAVILYCGCCPWPKCPNIRPATRAALEMGFRHLEVLYLPHSFARDWVRRGYPIAGRDAR